VLRETTSRGLCGLGCPSRTSERGGEGDCVKEGGGGEGKCERERALERLRYMLRALECVWKDAGYSTTLKMVLTSATAADLQVLNIRVVKQTTSTTATRHVYMVNTTARALLEPSVCSE
jgi:hypothetical protein